MKRRAWARPFRVRAQSLRVAVLGWGLLGLAGCAANCLRDSDCDDAHLCRHDRCELLGSSARDAHEAGAGQAGASGSSSSTSEGGAGGSATAPDTSSGGSATVPDTSSGGSATGGRDNLDASPG